MPPKREQRHRISRANAATVRAAHNNAPSAVAESLPTTSEKYPSTVHPIDSRGLYLMSNIPKRHQRAINEAESPSQWLHIRDRVIGRIGEGFIIALLGTRGPGKTQIAEQAIRYCSHKLGDKAARPSLYVRAMDVFLDLRATYNADAPDTERSVIEKFCAPQLLVVDECQERGESAWEDRMLSYVIDRRYGDMKDTILIANLMEKAFRESVGTSIMSRLIETGEIIECVWPSFRRRTESIE